MRGIKKFLLLNAIVAVVVFGVIAILLLVPFYTRTGDITLHFHSGITGNLTVHDVEVGLYIKDEGDTPTSRGNVTTPSATQFINTGHRFLGWRCMKTNELFAEKTRLEGFTDADDGRVFQAEWQAITYHITFNLNAQFFQTTPLTVPDMPVNYGQILSGVVVPTSTTHTFHGWFTQHGGFGTEVHNGMRFGLTRNLAAFAYWTRNDTPVQPQTFTITLRDTSRNQTVGTFNHTSGQPLPVSVAVPQPRAGYNFTGWFDSASPPQRIFNEKGERVTSGAVHVHGNVTLTAGWEQVSQQQTFTVTLRDTSRNQTVGTFNHTSGHSLPEYVNLPQPRSGYTFTGWFDSLPQRLFNELGRRVTSGPAHINSNVTLTAGWILDSAQVQTFTITLRDTARDITVDSFVHTNGQALRETVKTPSPRDGYRFLGWFNSANVQYFTETGARVTSGAVSFTSNETFIAGWRQESVSQQTFTISLRDEARNINVYSFTHTSGQALRTTPVPIPGSSPQFPVRAGFRFDGWFDTSGQMIFNASGNRATTGAVTLTSNVTLIARWTPL